MLLYKIPRKLFAIAYAGIVNLSTKDNRLLVFGSSNGQEYGDNSAALFEWVLGNRPDLNPLWITKSSTVLENLRTTDKPVELATSHIGLNALRRARAAFFTNSLNDIAFDAHAIPSSLLVIALRHGKSVKRVRYAARKINMTLVEKWERKKETRVVNYAISTSEFISDLQEESLRIGREKHIVTGYPRNDLLFEIHDEVLREWDDFWANANNKPRKVILYAPSWRHGRKPTRFFPFDDFDPKRLTEELEDRKWEILIRPHKNELKDFPDTHPGLAALINSDGPVRMASHREFPDIHRFLPFIDILISDYSSLYHDFLLLDRPIIFIPYDYEEFQKETGFAYDYFDWLPGPSVNSLTDLLNQFAELDAGNDSFKERRKNLTDKVHKYMDSSSRERVLSLLDSPLN